jgi:hypothetical protein
MAGQKRQRKPQKKIESATKKRRVAATTVGAVTGIGLGAVVSPLIQQSIAIAFPLGTAAVHRAMALTPLGTMIAGGIVLGYAGNKLYNYSIKNLTPKK